MCLYDIDEKQITSALAGILKSLQELEDKGLLTNYPIKTAKEAHQFVHGCSDLGKAVDGAIYIQVCQACVIVVQLFKSFISMYIILFCQGKHT